MKRGRDEVQSNLGPGGAKRPAAGGAARPGANASAQQQNTKLTTNDALTYLRDVKNRFADRKDVYDTFLEIMKEFKAQRIDTAGVIVRVKQLFKGHRNLILGFNTFLPKGYEIELARVSDDEEDEEQKPKQPVEFDQAINYVNKIKTRFANDERVYKAFLEILNMYRKGQKTIQNVYEEVAVLFRNHADLLEEFTYFLPDNSNQNAAPARRPPYGAGRGAAARPPMGQRVSAPGSPTDHSRLMHKRKAARKAEEGFRRMDEDEYGYGRPYSSSGGRHMVREMKFIETVRQRLRGREQFGDFLKVLNMYSQDIITRQELVGLVSDIFQKAADLMGGFHQFFASCENIDMGELVQALQRSGMSNRELLKAKLQKDKYMTKPLSEIVAGETERITPSYVKIPPGYPRLVCTGRTDVGSQVLNDAYVNVITGSEDYSFKLMRKNQYEEALFRCEDDRYEFDISIEQGRSTIKKLRPYVAKIAAMTPEERAHFRLEEGELTPFQLGHIQRLYADQGPLMLDLLRKNPTAAIPVILARLEQKDAEWTKIKEEMNKTWKRIYEQNYPRSLDHRSFYFKQGEKKLLVPKAMVSELKESADRRKADEQHLRNMSMAHRYSGAPLGSADLSFEYADKTVFQDTYTILRTAIECQVHPGARDQVLELYVRIVEPFFGLPVRNEELDRLKAEHGDVEEGGVEARDLGDAKSDTSMEPGEGKVKTEDTGAGDDMGGRGGMTSEANTDADDEEMSGVPMKREDSSNASAGRASHTGRGYEGCKPIRPWCGPAAADVASSSGQQQQAGTRLLYGNEHMYVFFRYHRYLYDRLCNARRLAMDAAYRKQQGLRNDGGGGGETRTPLDGQTDALVREEAERIHGQFVASLTALLSNTGLDVTSYEDQVRLLMGTNSYVLFTLDKLLIKLLKHMQLMVQDEPTYKLWELYHYEQKRTSSITRAVYHVNCHTILDDVCYRIEFKDGSSMLEVQMNDPEKTDSFLAPEGMLPEYIKQYIANTATQAQPVLKREQEGEREPAAALFLRRNVPPKVRESLDAAITAELPQLLVVNGLECKISCTSCKVSYVLDTEDVMCRRARRRRQDYVAKREKRAVRFNRWHEETVARLEAAAARDDEAEAALALVSPAAAQ